MSREQARRPVQSSFQDCLAFTLGEEGGFSQDPRDGGCYLSGRPGEGALIGSNRGISAVVLAAWMHPTAPTAEAMRAIGPQTVEAICRTLYWQPINGERLPAGIDLMVLDHGFNAGVAAAARILQRCLGVISDGWIGDATLAAIGRAEPRDLLDLLDADAAHGLQQALGITTDGVIGPQTQKALAVSHVGPSLLLIAAIAAAQSSFYRQLAGFPEFGAGWIARTHRRQLAASRLALASPTIPHGSRR